MTAQADNPKLTITLTGRGPIKITKDEWPIIASAEDFEHDGKIEWQANIRSNWKLIVRQHSDLRTLVYGVYSYDTNYENARNYQVRGGEMVTNTDTEPEAMNNPLTVPGAIRRVGEWMAAQEQPEEDRTRWQTLINECIADLPAEEI